MNRFERQEMYEKDHKVGKYKEEEGVNVYTFTVDDVKEATKPMPTVSDILEEKTRRRRKSDK